MRPNFGRTGGGNFLKCNNMDTFTYMSSPKHELQYISDYIGV